MKKTISIKLVICAFIAFTISSCSSDGKPESSDIWANTTWVTLEKEAIKFRKPNKLMRSSRYRIERDSPTIAKDKQMLRVLQNTLESLEFQDSEIDVFIDTTTYFHVLIICNVAPINFGARDVAIIKQQLTEQNRLAELTNPNLNYEEVNAKLKRSSEITLAKFETKIVDPTLNSSIYNSIYYLTTKSYSLIVYEFSDYRKDIENYLWSVKTI